MLSHFSILKETLNNRQSDVFLETDSRHAHLEMPQLPYTSAHENNNLRYAVPHSLGVGRLAQIPIIRLPFPLVLLLSPDILELRI